MGLDAILGEESGDADVIAARRLDVVLPLADRRDDWVEVIDRKAFVLRIGEDKVGGQRPAVAFVRSAEGQRILRAARAVGELDARLLIEDVFLEILVEGVLFDRMAREVDRRTDEVSVVDELLLNCSVPEYLDGFDPWSQFASVIDREAVFALIVVRTGNVEIRQPIEPRVDGVQQLTIDDGLV